VVPLRYLSLEWIDALSTEIAGSEAMRAAAEGRTIGVTQAVTGGPEGDVVYHLQVADGQARFEAGPAWPEDVRMEQDWETAVAVATGDLNAQEAFLTGRIRLSGDQQKLIAAMPIFAALDSVFANVRARTEYR
jgi:putative sterol carrier protein